MKDPVKRSYSSPRRDEQARQTRRAVLAAAGRLFTEAGYGATSLQQVADEAGVAVQTIYAAFGNKKALLDGALDVAIAGDDEPVPVNERDWMRVVFEDPDPVARLAAYATAVAGILQRAGALFGVLAAAAHADPDLAHQAATAEERRRVGASSVIAGLAAMGALDPNLDERRATDILWTLNSPELHQRLVRGCGWPLDNYRDWLSQTMATALLNRAGPDSLAARG
jgi:AcrR family transcriptional regulator